jgi:hypothetical protein
MAEAHSAVAFSFSITHEGWDVNFDREVLHLVWQSGIRSWKKRLARFKVRILTSSFREVLCQFFIIMWKIHREVIVFIFFGGKCFSLCFVNTDLLKNGIYAAEGCHLNAM